ncbi:DUF4113 domain-containing protein [Spirosoma endophyticum]|uniref:DUF4113 domain-containing protein n=1 Tax=Spirosoma endophyticum TaxID=662367 RepID=A0A1I2GD11_9BACT|nr:DUF4113 domain-containing protein [Spirosoma endophyticum]SFF14551.1 protein of unknown function [Spirosoma endophyticum]
MFLEAYQNKKAGLIVTGIVPADKVQPDMFDTTDCPKLKDLSEVMDVLNGKFGRDTVIFAAQKTNHDWQPKFEQRSPSFTTDWRELPKIPLD